MRSKDITIHPFGTVVKLCSGKSVNDILMTWNEKYTPHHDLSINDMKVGTNGCVLKIPDKDGLLCFALMLEDNCTDEVIVHEVFHLVMHLANFKGCEWSEESDEWYAYCVKNTFIQVQQFIRKNNNRGQRKPLKE